MPKNTLSQKEMNVLEKVDQQFVAEHNDLIQATAKMDQTAMKLFEMAVAGIDTKKGTQKDRTVLIPKRTVLQFVQAKDHNRSKKLNELIDDATNRMVFKLQRPQRNIKLFPFEVVEWCSEGLDDYIKFKFTESFMPYVSELKANFTQFKLETIASFSNTYTIVLFKWLTLYYNQYLYYRQQGTRSEVQLREFSDPKVELTELEDLLNVKASYRKRFDNFSKYVLDKSLSEIEGATNLRVAYEKERDGRKIRWIQFHIQSRTQVKSASHSRTTVDPLKYEAAVNSKYTVKLLSSRILDPLAVTNKSLMIKLSTDLYPKYDEFAAKYGMKTLDKHLDYVGAHLTKTPKKLAGYLNSALENYEKTGIKKTIAKSSRAQHYWSKIDEKMPGWTTKTTDELNTKAPASVVAEVKEMLEKRKSK